MAEVAKIDIDGVQWDIKDQNARDRIATLEVDNTTNKTNIQNLQNNKMNIVAEQTSVDLNTLGNAAFENGTVKYFKVAKGSLNEPDFPTMSETIDFYNMKVSKGYRSLIQEIECIYPNVAGNWAYIKFRRAQIDALWFSWKTIESYVM